MPLIDSALAFAITMLALSLTCSAFIELIHRACKMREAGLKYMLEQMFDQVLRKYARALADNSKTGPEAYKNVRESFVKSMTANRAPIGFAAGPELTVAPMKDTKGTDNSAANDTSKPKSLLEKIRGVLEKIWGVLKDIWREPGIIWGGRSITRLTPVEFMERLGSTDLGKKIKDAAGKDAADAEAKTDAVLKDIALKFEAFGKDAATYFEGRARFLSVAVAIALALAIHVDAIDLFKTYLQNPNTTASVIAQSQAITGQMKSMQEAAEASKKIAGPPADGTNQSANSQQGLSSAEVKAQADGLQKEAVAAISNARNMIKQFTDLGVPFGWSDARIEAADMWVLVWTCKEPKPTSWFHTLGQKCNDDVPKHDGLQLQYKNVWFGIPAMLNVWFCLLLGGFLIGLGAPFWYDAVTGLANFSKVLGGGSGSGGAAAGTAQPVTPAGVFNASSTARAAGAAPVEKTADNPAAQ
jgi:hypothetical protein